MNRLKIIAAVFAMVIAGRSIGAESAPAAKSQATNLVMIVMNGVRYKDSYGDKNHLYFDNIWNKLKPQGSICTKFVNKDIGLPIPTQASMLTGVWHVYKNPFSKSIRPGFPTLFEYWNSSKKGSGNQVYFASSKPEFEILTHSTYEGFGKQFMPVFDDDKNEKVNENAIYEKALPYITEKHPSFVYLSLNAAGGTHAPKEELAAECPLEGQIDACGGSEGLNAYYESIILMDQIVFDLWDRIQQDDFYKNKTVLMVMSSHGRHTNEYYGYGDKCSGCTDLFFLTIGPGVKKGFVSTKSRSLIDVCKTAGTLLSIPVPYAKGEIMKELLE
jgi:Sulfatase